MKASEVIAELQKLISQFGDLETYFDDEYGDELTNEIEFRVGPSRNLLTRKPAVLSDFFLIG